MWWQKCVHWLTRDIRWCLNIENIGARIRSTRHNLLTETDPLQRRKNVVWWWVMIWLIKGDSPFLIFLPLALRMFSWLFWSSAFFSVSCFSCLSMLSISCWLETAASGRKQDNIHVSQQSQHMQKRFKIATLFSYCKYLSRNSRVTCLSEFSPIPQLLENTLDLFSF